jgi:hypothetical protein
MNAEVGSQIVVRGRKVGAPTRHGVVVAVRGEDGGPPYLVKWDGDPAEHLYYPGADALISARPRTS